MLHDEAIIPGTLGLLNDLFKLDVLSEFTLVGGTALALHIGHRYSEYLDFFTDKDFDEQKLLRTLQESFNLEISNASRNILNVYINNIKVDILSHKYHKIGNDVSYQNIRLASLEDISAMKINAITGRGAKKDFYDVYFLLEHFSLKEIVSFFERKYSNYSSFMVFKSLVYFEDAENEKDPEMIKPLKWQEVKKKMQVEVKRNFPAL